MSGGLATVDVGDLAEDLGVSKSARVIGTVITLPAWVQVMLAWGSLLSVRLACSSSHKPT